MIDDTAPFSAVATGIQPSSEFLLPARKLRHQLAAILMASIDEPLDEALPRESADGHSISDHSPHEVCRTLALGNVGEDTVLI
jgi:hypothetical protein